MSLIHVAHIVHAFGIGGLENGIVNLINEMDSSRFRFSIFSFTPELDSLDRITQKKVFFDVLYKREGNDWQLPFKLAQLFKKHRVDIVHTHGWSTYLEGLFAAKLAAVPMCIHGEHGIDLLDKWRRILAYKIFIYITDQILTVSDDLRNRFVKQYGLPSHKVKTIINGVNMQKFNPDIQARLKTRQNLGLSDQDIVIGTVGRLSFEKDYETLLRAVAMVILRIPNVRLLIIGDGDLRSALVTLSKQLGIKNYVQFLGVRNDVPYLLNAMDIFALTSICEGMPNTILEAMCVKLPVVATNVGGMPEVVIDGRTGFLVQAKQPQEIAEALIKIITFPKLLNQIREAGYQRVKTYFSLERMVQKYEETYIEFLERKKGRIYC